MTAINNTNKISTKASLQYVSRQLMTRFKGFRCHA